MNTPAALPFSIRIEGHAACFRRPEFVNDLITYDVIPPPVIHKLLDTLYSSSSARWALQRLRVLSNITSQWDEIRTARGRKRALILTDVCYLVEADLITRTHSPNERNIVMQAIQNAGPNAHLGLTDFPARISILANNDDPPSAHTGAGEIDLGWMLYDLAGEGRARARYFRPRMIDGMIDLREPGALRLAS